MENYELVEDIGSGNFGVARLMRNKQTKELVTMKYKKRNCSKDSYKEGKGLSGWTDPAQFLHICCHWFM